LIGKREGKVVPRIAKHKRNLTALTVQRAKAIGGKATRIWDAKCPGLVLTIQPSGSRSFSFVYSRAGDSQWINLGPIYLADARRIAHKLRAEIAEGRDPLSERQAQRQSLTFAALHSRYVEEYAKLHNKSWKQAHYLVVTYILPRLGKLDAKLITRGDVRTVMGKIKRPIVANQVLKAASAVFTWAVGQEIINANPARGITANPVTARDRVLSDTEVKLFWDALDNVNPIVTAAALRTVLLTGQRPGEVAHMCKEHIKDGWWEMPGKPSDNWPGTKNGASHRVWLTEEVRALLPVNNATGFVFATARGRPVAKLDDAMRSISAKLKLEPPVRPHDLRRTFGSTVTALGHGRQAMDRMLNHSDNSVGAVYDRHSYSAEDRRIMESVARHFMAIVSGCSGDTVVRGRF
jgi:integrase